MKSPISRALLAALYAALFFTHYSPLSAECEPASIDHCWSGKLKTGLTLDWGNTECTDICGGFCFKRQTTIDDCPVRDFFLSTDLRYKKKSDAVCENKGWGRVAYRFYLNDCWSFQVKQRLEYDSIKSLHLGSHTLASLGYWWINCEHATLITTAGLGYSYRKFSEKVDSSPVATLGCDGKIKIRHDLTFANIFEIIVPFDPPSEFSWLDVMKLCYDFSERWGLELCYKWEYLNAPSAGKERLDQKLDCSLVYQL